MKTLKLLVLGLMLLVFSISTVGVLREHGYAGFLELAGANSVSNLLLLDVTLFVLLASAWMLKDAKGTLWALPFVALSIAFGVAGLICYLLLRRWVGRTHEATTTGALRGAIGIAAVAFISVSSPAAAAGRLVDIGGLRLHLECVGTGAPTVVFDSGAGAWSIHWAGIQRQLGSSGGTICTYDRAGLGQSDASSEPRRTSVMVDELHRLLHNAGIVPPLILAGHSLGAWNARAYQARYPEEVAGLVLLDGAHEAQWSRLPPIVGQLVQMSVEGSRARAQQAIEKAIDPAAERAEAAYLKIAPDLHDAYVEAMQRPETHLAIAGEMELAFESAKDTPRSAPGSLADLPVVVLTASDSFAAFEGAPIPKDEANAAWFEMQRELALLSRNTVHLFSKGHHRLQDSDPGGVVTAVRRAIEMVAQRPTPRAALGLPSQVLAGKSKPAIDKLLREIEQAYRSMDSARFADLFTEEFTQLDVNRRMHVRGKAAWLEWTKQLNSMHTAMERTHHGRAIAGDWLVVELEWSGTVRGEAVGASAPRSYRFTGLGLIKLKDGKIDQQVIYGDVTSLMTQLEGLAAQE